MSSARSVFSYPKNGRHKAYYTLKPTGNQEARPVERSGGGTPNPALLGVPRSMRQSELHDYQCSGEQSHRDERTLRNLYWGEGLSVRAIGERLGVSGSTVRYWMKKHGIERRDRAESRQVAHARFGMDGAGYERWRATGFGDDQTVRVHKLLAIAEGADPHAVFGEAHIHHDNGVKWDNRPENIEVVDEHEHLSGHSRGESNPDAKLTEAQVREIRKRYPSEDVSHADLADDYGVSTATVSHILTGRNWGWLDE